MADGCGRSIRLAGPSELDEAGMPTLGQPQLIPIGVRPSGSSQPLRLAYVEDTVFTAMLDAHAPLRYTQADADVAVASSAPDESAY